ncbi:MAG: hypothetical protein LBN02_00660 [Oscillospiraceae bacterium]|nr:hypothetical protein [Oscillospiraceae bacterium]
MKTKRVLTFAVAVVSVVSMFGCSAKTTKSRYNYNVVSTQQPMQPRISTRAAARSRSVTPKTIPDRAATRRPVRRANITRRSRANVRPRANPLMRFSATQPSFSTSYQPSASAPIR